MHLESHITVQQSAAQVWALLNDPFFLSKWDRSVAEVIPTSTDTTSAVGFTFDTVAPKKRGQKQALRMSYRITEVIPGYQAKILLEQSPMFKDAVWTMRAEPSGAGCLITCMVDLTLKSQYFFLWPVLKLNKKALFTDLQYLERAIRDHYEGYDQGQAD